jgi:hypothetical protein
MNHTDVSQGLFSGKLNKILKGVRKIHFNRIVSRYEFNFGVITKRKSIHKNVDG